MPDLTLDWGAFGPYGTTIDGNETVDAGGIDVSVTFTPQDEDASAITFNAPGYVAEGEDFDDQSFLKLVGQGGEGGVDDTSITAIDFSSSDPLYADEVQNVAFRLNDIDGGGGDIDPGTPVHQDIVTVRAFDAEGNETPVEFTPGSAVGETGGQLTGDDTNLDYQDGDGSTLVSIAGPVARIEIAYQNGDIGEQTVMVSDVNFEGIENVVPCFTPGTAIATPHGERLVEDLKVGDKIITRDNGIQEIRWIGQRQLTGHELARAPHLRPILIQQGSLGHNLPEHDILVSPQHRFLINNDRTSLYFEETEVLVAAKHLTELKGVDEVGTLGVTYVHFMFDNHEVVLSNGAWTESFQPGQSVIDGLGGQQRSEIFELFPELQTEEGVKEYAAARRSLKKHEAKLLVR